MVGLFTINAKKQSRGKKGKISGDKGKKRQDEVERLVQLVIIVRGLELRSVR